MAKNSKRKGKSGELKICKILNARFGGEYFSRVVGSGNRWAQVARVSDDYISDLVTPEGFRFSIECKIGYSDVRVSGLLSSNKTIDDFLGQCKADAERAKKRPMLVWKQDRQPWIVFIYWDDYQALRTDQDLILGYYGRYREWLVASLDDLLGMGDSFFLEKPINPQDH